MSDAMAKALELQRKIEQYCTEHGDLPERIEEIKVARLQPGDVVLAKVTGNYGEDDYEYIRSRLEGIFPDNRVIVLDGVDLEIVRPEGGTCEHGHIRTFASNKCLVCGEIREESLPAPLVADPSMLTDIPTAGT